jgi:hypothetical protein
VTQEAERPEVLQAALAAALYYWNDMICVPPGALHPISRDSVSLPGFLFNLAPVPSVLRGQLPKIRLLLMGVYFADSTNAFVSFMELASGVAGIGPELPLMYAPV